MFVLSRRKQTYVCTKQKKIDICLYQAEENRHMFVLSRRKQTYVCTEQKKIDIQYDYAEVNIPLFVEKLKLYFVQAIQFIRGKNNSPSMSSIAHSSHMDIFQVNFLFSFHSFIHHLQFHLLIYPQQFHSYIHHLQFIY